MVGRGLLALTLVHRTSGEVKTLSMSGLESRDYSCRHMCWISVCMLFRFPCWLSIIAVSWDSSVEIYYEQTVPYSYLKFLVYITLIFSLCGLDNNEHVQHISFEDRISPNILRVKIAAILSSNFSQYHLGIIWFPFFFSFGWLGTLCIFVHQRVMLLRHEIHHSFIEIHSSVTTSLF